MPIGCWISIGVVVLALLAMALGCYLAGRCVSSVDDDS